VSADTRKTLEYFSRTVLAFYIGARGANLSLSLSLSLSLLRAAAAAVVYRAVDIMGQGSRR